jgi:hypothetical protein
MSEISKIRKILGGCSVADAIWALQHGGGTALERKMVHELHLFAPELATFPHRLRLLLTSPRVALETTSVVESNPPPMIMA